MKCSGARKRTVNEELLEVLGKHGEVERILILRERPTDEERSVRQGAGWRVNDGFFLLKNK
jgi:hypothetical protein